jgi:hypothetical protein
MDRHSISDQLNFKQLKKTLDLFWEFFFVMKININASPFSSFYIV